MRAHILWLNAKEKREREEKMKNACRDLLETFGGKGESCKNFQVAVVVFAKKNREKAVGFVGLRRCDLTPPIYFLESLCIRPSPESEIVAEELLRKLNTLRMQKVFYLDKNEVHARLLAMCQKHGFAEVKNHLFLPLNTECERLLVAV